MNLATIFYSLRFETPLFVASYDSQGHGGGIRPRLTGGSLYTLRTKSTENTSHVISSQRVHWRADCCLATSYNIRPLRRIFHCCTLERVYRAVDQIRYDINTEYSSFLIVKVLTPDDGHIGRNVK
jgi:hypothetical protein